MEEKQTMQEAATSTRARAHANAHARPSPAPPHTRTIQIKRTIKVVSEEEYDRATVESPSDCPLHVTGLSSFG